MPAQPTPLYQFQVHTYVHRLLWNREAEIVTSWLALALTPAISTVPLLSPLNCAPSFSLTETCTSRFCLILLEP